MPETATAPAPERVLLGREQPFLAAVAHWLLDRFGTDQEGVVVALPGSRAGRRLEEVLVAAAGPALRPPRVTTAGAAADLLLRPPESPRASRLLRTLLWAEILREMPEDRRSPVLPRPPAPEEEGAWLGLGAMLRTLHAEVAAGGWRFAQVLERVPKHEKARWRVLAAIQERYAGRLAELGRHDPHLARLEAVAGGRVRPPRALVLAGVLELHGLERRILAAAVAGAGAGRFFALLPAGREDAGAFDAWGCVRPAAWLRRELPLDPERWRVLPDPAAEADAVLATLRDLSPPPAAEDVVLGVPEPGVGAALATRLDAAGVPWQETAGRPLPATLPGQFLAGLAAFLARPHAASLAELLRHPDVEEALARAGAGAGWLAALDRWQAEAVPGALDPALEEPWQVRRSADGERLERVRLGLRELLAPLRDARPLPDWAPPLRGLLARVTPASLDLDRPRDWERHQALRLWLGLLEELAGLPGDGRPVAAATALRLLLEAGAERRLPPFPGPPAAALAGWLELLHEDAPVVLLTGFQEGVLPAAPATHPFLPDGLRRDLGLACAESRYARDACALELLLATPAAGGGERQVWLFSARRGADGDPLRPSRLAFACPEAEVPARMARFLASAPPTAGPAAAAAPPRPAELPRDPAAPPLEAVSVTAFRDWLASPYLFYLKHVLGLEEVAPPAREMDALVFGSLAHEVLQGLGEEPGMDACEDPEAVADFLLQRLADCFRARFGPRPEAALRLQRAILELRLRVLAAWQAGEARKGWRIARVEAALPEECRLEAADGTGGLQVRGRVDRVDRHPEEGWRILDYKTGDRPLDPRQAHGPARGDPGAWRDLQLPLYGHFLPRLIPEARGRPVALGYACLSREGRSAQVLRCGDWSPDELAAALDVARTAVASMLRGDSFAIGDWPRHEDGILALVAGRGLLVAARSAGTEEEA